VSEYDEGYTDLGYTRESLIKQLLLIQNHGVDGSAVEAGCGCIEDKHLYIVEALAEEGATIAVDPKEKRFYAQLSDLARYLRKRIDMADWNMHGVMRDTMKPYAAKPVRTPGNPRSRSFLPHNLTACETAHPSVQAKLARCIQEVELKCCGTYTTDYSACTCNPVAVCRASVPCP
jgi:hypothetical protein